MVAAGWLSHETGACVAYVCPSPAPQGGIGMSTGERVFSALTVPLPLCLNLYWFNLMVRKAVRTASASSDKSE